MPKRALVVDNERFCVQILKDILTQAGFTVSTATDGMEAMEALRRDPPDVLFLDLVMPRIDGDRVFHYVRQDPRTAQIPVVIVSGTLAEDPDALLGLGADAYVAKGPTTEMQRNVLAVLDRLARSQAGGPPPVLGAEHLTPRHKVKELMALRRYVYSLLQAIAEGVVEVDDRRRILLANAAALRMVGCSELDLVGTPIGGLLGAEHREVLETAIAQCLADGETPARLTVRLRGRVLEVSLARIETAQCPGGFFLLLRDVTDLARKIEQLSAANERLQTMDRTRAELFTMISHDLHTPLTAIKGSLEVLLHEGVGAELGRELLGIAQKNTDRLFRLVSDILDLARIESGQFRGRLEAFDVVACLRGVVERLQLLAYERGITILFEAPEDIPLIQADGIRLEQVFTNLLGNALKYTAKAGRIDVRACDRGADLLVQVRDTGAGIPAEHLTCIFDRFYRVPGAHGGVEGTGLGLSICKAVVEAHGGRIWAESVVGQGSTFSLTIPKAPSEGAEAGRAARTGAE
jgi:PAS domain S-box-containing protein